MTRDERFVALAAQAKMVTEAQVEDARKLQALLVQNGFKLTLPEILTRKEYVTVDQARLLNITIRYEEIREDDLALGAFLTKKGFLSDEKVRECLGIQEQPYKEGRLLPRLRDLVVQKNYLTAQQLQVILRARQQFDPSSRPPSNILPAMGGPRSAEEPAPAGGAAPAPAEAPSPIVLEQIPPGRPGESPAGMIPPLPEEHAPVRRKSDPLIPSREEASSAIPARTESSLRMPVVFGPKEIEAGLAIDHLRVSYRKSRLKDGPASETVVSVLDLEGVIDAHTFKKFDHYLTAAIDNKGPLLILNCEKLDYVSSAGIGVLAGATKRCRDRQGDLRLCSVNDKVKKIVNLVGLQSMLRMYEGERGALMSFKFM